MTKSMVIMVTPIQIKRNAYPIWKSLGRDAFEISLRFHSGGVFHCLIRSKMCHKSFLLGIYRILHIPSRVRLQKNHTPEWNSCPLWCCPRWICCRPPFSPRSRYYTARDVSMIFCDYWFLIVLLTSNTSPDGRTSSKGSSSLKERLMVLMKETVLMSQTSSSFSFFSCVTWNWNHPVIPFSQQIKNKNTNINGRGWHQHHFSSNPWNTCIFQ